MNHLFFPMLKKYAPRKNSFFCRSIRSFSIIVCNSRLFWCPSWVPPNLLAILIVTGLNLAFQPDALSDVAILSMDDVETAYYLRMEAEDRPGVLADVTKVLGDKGISIEAMIQKEPAESEDKASIIMLTHSVMEKQMNDAIAQIEKLDAIAGSVTRIRMETLG